jgi:hypothetical protein
VPAGWRWHIRRRSRCWGSVPGSGRDRMDARSAGQRVTLLLRRVGVRRRATAQVLLLHIVAAADGEGILRCERDVLASLLGISESAVTKTLQRLAADGLELRVPYGTGADGRPLFAAPGHPLRLRVPDLPPSLLPPVVMGADQAPGKSAGQARVDTSPAPVARVDTSSKNSGVVAGQNPCTRVDTSASTPADVVSTVDTTGDGYPQMPAQARVDTITPFAEGWTECPPFEEQNRRSEEGWTKCPPMLSPPPSGVGERARVGTRGRARETLTPVTRRTYPDGTARDYDSASGRVHYRCCRHARELGPCADRGPDCPACARVRATHEAALRPHRRRQTAPPPQQRPLVAALPGGQQQSHGPNPQCALCDEHGRVLGSARWCEHSVEAMARTDAARAAARAAAQSLRRGRRGHHAI